MARRHAEEIPVSVEQTRTEIEEFLVKHGATNIRYGCDEQRAVLTFQLRDRHIRFIVPIPQQDAFEFRLTADRRRRRAPAAQQRAWEQGIRTRWRALLLIIQVKLEAAAAGVVTLEDEFLAHTMLPGGKSVSEMVTPRVDATCATGEELEMLPFPGTPPALGEGTP